MTTKRLIRDLERDLKKEPGNLAMRLQLGAEALVRWLHPTRGLLMPDDFLSIAEETGLIAQLDAWVMEQAFPQTMHFAPGGIH